MKTTLLVHHRYSYLNLAYTLVPIHFFSNSFFYRHRDFCGSAEIEQPTMSPRPAHWQPTTVQKGRPRKRKPSVDSPTLSNEDINANIMRLPSSSLGEFLSTTSQSICIVCFT